MTKEPITTTLSKIRNHSPCEGLWEKLCKNLGGPIKYGEDTPLKFSQIIESNGLHDALWCLRSICPEHEKEVRIFAVDCAERVLHIYEDEFDDDRPRKTIEDARAFANGEITKEESRADRAAARAAAQDAAMDGKTDAMLAAMSACINMSAWINIWDVVVVVAWTATEAARVDAHDDEQKAQVEMLIERFG